MQFWLRLWIKKKIQIVEKDSKWLCFLNEFIDFLLNFGHVEKVHDLNWLHIVVNCLNNI